MCVKVLYVSNKLEDIHNTYRHSPHQTLFPQHLHQGDHGHVQVHHVHVYYVNVHVHHVHVHLRQGDHGTRSKSFPHWRVVSSFFLQNLPIIVKKSIFMF